MMAALSAASVARELSLPDQLMPWLESLEQSDPPSGGLQLPRGNNLAELLSRLAVVEPDLSAIVDALPDPLKQPELWWLLERSCQQLQRTIGNWDAPARLPALPNALGPAGRCFWIFVFLVSTPAVRRWHTLRGISDDVSWSTLADLGRHVSRYRRRNAATGLDAQFWLGLHYRGALYELGRLQFSPFRLRTGMAGPLFWYEGEAAVARGSGFQVGDPVLGLHVPAGSPLLPAECDASFLQAGLFFERHFPHHASPLVTCTSWLLDEQLADYLPRDSNIVQFQRRFELVPGARDHDDEVFRWVFERVPTASLDDLSPQTELEHVLIRHVRAGGHWRMRTGWLLLS